MKILLAIDDSKFCEIAAETLIAQYPHDSEVQVLHVVVPLTFSAVPQMAAGYAPELEGQQKEGQKLTTQVAETLNAAGFKAKPVVQTGDPRAIIVDLATQWGADLVVVGSHGRSGLERFLLGSVSASVARHAPCSVLIVRSPSH